MLVSQNSNTAAILVSQTSPVGVELFSEVHAFFCGIKPLVVSTPSVLKTKCRVSVEGPQLQFET